MYLSQSCWEISLLRNLEWSQSVEAVNIFFSAIILSIAMAWSHMCLKGTHWEYLACLEEGKDYDKNQMGSV